MSLEHAPAAPAAAAANGRANGAEKPPRGELRGPEGPRAGHRAARRRHPRIFLSVFLALALFVSLTLKLFVWPAHDGLKGLRADAVLVMGGPGPRWAMARQLALQHAAGVVLVSTSSVQWDCPDLGVPGVRVECFRPHPFSTQGEARYGAEQAREHGWHSLVVVSSVAQATRARLRVQRCFRGTVRMVVVRPSLLTWAYEVVYEWGAMAKAEVWQRTC